MVEGDLADGAHVVLVEDLIFDGGSKVNFINGLRTAGLSVNHAFTIASYGFHDEYTNPGFRQVWKYHGSPTGPLSSKSRKAQVTSAPIRPPL